MHDNANEAVDNLAAIINANAEDYSLDSNYIELMLVNIAGQKILIAVPEVAEIIKVQTLTKVSMVPDHLLGVCNVHGQVTCVVDPCRVMHLKGLAEADSQATRFVILRHPQMRLALRVDGVLELMRILESKLPKVDDDFSGFFSGEVDVEGELYSLMYVKELFK